MKLILLILLFFVSCFAERHKSITIFSEDLPPYSYYSMNKAEGMAVEAIKEIMRQYGQKHDDIEIMNFNKALNIVQNTPYTLLFPVSRTTKREQLFKWVGPLFNSKSYLYKLKRDIKTYKDGKEAEGIAVVRNYASERKLIDQNYHNLIPVDHTSEAIKMLFTPRAQLADVGEYFLPFRAKQAGISYNQLTNTGIMILEHKQYIAFHRDTPDPIIEKWQKALDEMKENGKYKEIFEKEYHKAINFFDIK